MPLNKTKLIADLQTAGEKASEKDNRTPEQRREQWAIDLANAIDLFVKSGTVTVNVVTTGTATNHTGTGTGNIS